MTEKQILEQTTEHVRQKMSGEGSGHDWWHVQRVVTNALVLAELEGGDLFIIELAALLHDIADHKFHDGDELAGSRAVRMWLGGLDVDEGVIEQVAYIVDNVSYKGGLNKHKMQSIEGKIVQDADRLDALGAIGIARAFTFGGAMGKEIHNPESKPSKFKNMAQVQADLKKGNTINHFYEKLLLLRDRLNTEAAKKIADSRHEYMERFLKEFYAEWEGKA